jgi:hypothetical protein
LIHFEPISSPVIASGRVKIKVILTGVILMMIAVFAALSVILVQHSLASMFLVGLG